MMLPALRFLLAPILVAFASLAARRWGARVGGLVAALPFVAGPLLFVITFEHGTLFGAQAASAALSGIAALAVFAVAYAHLSRALRWPAALVAGWALYLGSAALLRPLEAGTPARLVGALASLWVARALLPARSTDAAETQDGQKPSWDIPARMGSSALLVGGIASLSEALGPSWSGLLAPFPIATTILVAFAHAQEGPAAVVRLLEGFLPALAGLALFFAVLAVTLPIWGIAAGFAAAFAAALATQAAMLVIRPARAKSLRRRPD